MSISKTLLSPTVIAVAPTETTLLSLSIAQMRSIARLVVQVANLDAVQSFAGVIYRRQTGMVAWAAASLPDFSYIGPLASVQVDLDCDGTDELELRGTLSGAGGNVRIGAMKKEVTFL